MKNYLIAVLVFIVSSAGLSSCGEFVEVFAPTFTVPAPTPTPSPSPIPPTPTPNWFDERPIHFSTTEDSLSSGYAYRSTLQIPAGMAWGPDGLLYIADPGGEHIIRGSEQGIWEDLGIWKNINDFRGDGPKSVAFDSQGQLYFSNLRGIFKYEINGGEVEKVYSSENPDIGSIAIGSDDALYFSVMSEQGGIYTLRSDGSSELIASVPFAENLAISPDGYIYATRTKSCPSTKTDSPSGCHASTVAAKKRTSIVKVNLETGRTQDFHSLHQSKFNDSMYIVVDNEGNIWLRGRTFINYISQSGEEQPHAIYDSVLKLGHQYNYGPAGGITFDDQGRLWVGSKNSSVWLLNPVGEEMATQRSIELDKPTFTRELVIPGLHASALSISRSGHLYLSNENPGEVWKIPLGENHEVISSYIAEPWAEGWTSILVDAQDSVYVAYTFGSIFNLDLRGNRQEFADIFTRSMVFGSNGNIYAVGGDVEKFKEVVEIDEAGKVLTLAIDVDGTPLGNGEVQISIADENGFYIFIEENSTLYYLDYEDNSRLISDLNAITFGSSVVMTSSPASGNVFIAPVDETVVYLVSPTGESTIFAEGFIGGITAMDVSPDGKSLYTAEPGVISKIDLP